jgi:hypothetical protein
MVAVKGSREVHKYTNFYIYNEWVEEVKLRMKYYRTISEKRIGMDRERGGRGLIEVLSR